MPKGAAKRPPFVRLAANGGRRGGTTPVRALSGERGSFPPRAFRHELSGRALTRAYSVCERLFIGLGRAAEVTRGRSPTGTVHENLYAKDLRRHLTIIAYDNCGNLQELMLAHN